MTPATWNSIWHIYSDILSGILSVLSHIFSDILSDISSHILSGIRSDMYNAHVFRHSIWHSCPLSSGGHRWDSAVPVDIQRSRLAGGGRGEGEGEGRDAALIKSRDPHLSSGETMGLPWFTKPKWSTECLGGHSSSIKGLLDVLKNGRLWSWSKKYDHNGRGWWATSLDSLLSSRHSVDGTLQVTGNYQQLLKNMWPCSPCQRGKMWVRGMSKRLAKKLETNLVYW